MSLHFFCFARLLIADHCLTDERLNKNKKIKQLNRSKQSVCVCVIAVNTAQRRHYSSVGDFDLLSSGRHRCGAPRGQWNLPPKERRGGEGTAVAMSSVFCNRISLQSNRISIGGGGGEEARTRGGGCKLYVIGFLCVTTATSCTVSPVRGGRIL